ncbi:sugar MFS transporter [Luteibaculum oceani]|uniref:Sugar MFS transporter n=2 Tax=Luteibaculum oceani TaxID=1294296 RepID=A0A5C6V8I8_9FLAO|nr:sugar MFS transporter [Luteibaculum oceani]
MASNNKALSTLITVFFFWGFVAASNTVLIGIFKENFNLSQFESQLVDLAFYGAYFIGSLIYFILSKTSGDPLNKIGYKRGLILGLVISALGSFCFIPAAKLGSYPLMLGGLFVVGLGFALQQIVANPFVIALGEAKTGSHRINLAGAINSLGTTIGPLLISYAIFGAITASVDVSISKVQIPYTILAVAFLLVGLFIYRSNLPEVKSETDTTKGLGALSYPQLIWGMVGIFVYVGTEVTIQSNLPALCKELSGLETKDSVHLISLYWGCLMVGRWAGSVQVFKPSAKWKYPLFIAAPFLAYALVVIVNLIKGSPIDDFLSFLPFIMGAILMFIATNNKPARTMFVFGLLGAACMTAGLIASGMMAAYFFIAGGLFCSVLWPCIFSLSLAGLGKYTTQGSSLLIMMILGGAIIPPIQGAIADNLDHIQASYMVPLIGFLILALYGSFVQKALVKQGIDYDQEIK